MDLIGLLREEARRLEAAKEAAATADTAGEARGGRPPADTADATGTADAAGEPGEDRPPAEDDSSGGEVA